ncbi:hypothetical protein [uncultured Sphingomonas sp.]|uniref:hypothetical protein n=1 Tax=uncultured Sphingomonas sp. TaxID=158754 RepID=UPI0035C9EAD5
MTFRLIPLLALVAAVPGAAQGPAPPNDAPVQWAQLSIHERIVIRIPRMRRDPDLAASSLPGEPAPRWTEKKGARCVPAEDIIGATVPRSGSVDLIMADGQRTRALLESDCPALDYYLGFYIKPTSDGQVCAGRDSIRSRSGAACPIHSFRRLVPRR